MSTKEVGIVELSTSELATVTGAGWSRDQINDAYNAMWDVWEGIKEGYAAADDDTDIHYGDGNEGLPPPNA